MEENKTHGDVEEKYERRIFFRFLGFFSFLGFNVRRSETKL